MSWESSTLVSAFEKPLRLERAEAYKARIRQWGEVESELRRFVADNVFVDIHDQAAYLIRLISHAPGKPK